MGRPANARRKSSPPTSRRTPSPAQVKAIRDILVDAEGELGVADFWKGKEDKRFIDNDLY
ncbi:MAG: hypothetical protein V8Q84_05330 [Bilophila sp.]